MSTTPRIVADFETQLSTALAIGGVTFSISSILDDDGVTIPDGTYCVTVDNGSTSKEYLIGTMVGGNFTAVQSISRQGLATTGAARAHRVGASVIITDFIAIKRVADIIGGHDTLDGSSPLSYDTTPTLSDGKQLATVAYVLSVVTGGTTFFSSQIIQGTAGETVAAPKVGYFKASDQEWHIADSATLATYDRVRLGIFQGSATVGGGVPVQLSGLVSGLSGLTPGSKYYLGAAGAISTTPGTASVLIGYAISSTTLLLEIGTSQSPNYIQKDFLSGVTGMVVPYLGSAAPTGFLLCDGSLVSRTTYAALFAVVGTSFGAGDGSTTFALPDLRGRALVGAGTGTRSLTISGNAANVLTVTGASNIAQNGLQTGQAVVFVSVTAGNLVNATTYYIIRTGNLTFSLATTLANAQNGVVITLAGTEAGSFTQALTARAIGDVGGEETHAMSSTELLSHAHVTPGQGSVNVTNPSLGYASNNDTFTRSTNSAGGNAAMNNMQPFGVVSYIVKT